MKKTKFLIVLILFLISCADQTRTVLAEKKIKTVDTLNMGCRGCSELLETGETVNEVYGNGKIKHGHWITYEMVILNKKQTGRTHENNAAQLVRVKTEEGYYRYNKKEGFWKFYTEEGTLKDSIEYIHDVPVKTES